MDLVHTEENILRITKYRQSAIEFQKYYEFYHSQGVAKYLINCDKYSSNLYLFHQRYGLYDLNHKQEALNNYMKGIEIYPTIFQVLQQKRML